jgi:A/G-specific adenine glycosylase
MRLDLQEKLLKWYRAEARDLPWRASPTPYRVWLCEIMCQQTRIDTVLPYYHRFLNRWPSVSDLGRADLDEVLKEWAGLGYYSRARNLHKAAQQVAEMGAFPQSAKALQALPGIGAYTAAAIASIAFEKDAHLVDGNVERVLSRYFGMTLCVRSKDGKKALWEKAESIFPTGQGRDWNQALMEWGALICLPRNPRCGQCPVAEPCVARKQDLIQSLPYKSKKTKVKKVFASCGVWRQADTLLLRQRPEGGLLGGLWECPGTAMEMEPPSPSAFLESWGPTGNALGSFWKDLGEVRHVFTHRDLRQRVLLLDCPPNDLPLPTGARWVGGKELQDLALSRLTQKVLELAAAAD